MSDNDQTPTIMPDGEEQGKTRKRKTSRRRPASSQPSEAQSGKDVIREGEETSPAANSAEETSAAKTDINKPSSTPVPKADAGDSSAAEMSSGEVDEVPTDRRETTSASAAAGKQPPQQPPGDKGKKHKEFDEKKMPFLDHLEELRWTILRSLLGILVGSVICFIFQKQLVDFLRAPAPDDLKLIYLSLPEGFVIYLKVAIFGGFIISLPYIAWEFWRFIVPGLLEKERKLVPTIVFYTVFCFLLGGAFAYYVMIPFAVKFLLGFQTEYLEATITIGKFLGFVVTFILAFGVVFELPVLSFLLSKLGILSPEFLRSVRRYSIVTIFIVAAILTPPDVMTQTMLAIPLIILYEVSIWVSAAVARKRKQAEENSE